MVNAGDFFILLIIALAMAGLAGLTVYEIMEKRDDRAHEQRNGTTDYWEDAPAVEPGAPEPEATDRS